MRIGKTVDQSVVEHPVLNLPRKILQPDALHEVTQQVAAHRLDGGAGEKDVGKIVHVALM